MNYSWQEIAQIDQEYYMPTFGQRAPVLFTHGVDCTLYDQEGKEYTDFLAGIATNALGYAHPIFTETICQQAQKLIHISNYFYIESQALLAQKLCQETCADRVFFCNSGGEANEGALKLARKHFYGQSIDRYEIISTHNSFHGRTIATATATGQEKYNAPFAPLVGGIKHVPYDDLAAMEAAIGIHTAAILVEPIQGEGGIIEGGKEYLQGLRRLCDQYGLLLIFDEIQTGMGRSGHLFAYQHYDVEPDIFTVAKALGNGLPIGAVCCKESCSSFVAGDHGTTFGGNPLCTAGALCTLNIISQPEFLSNIQSTGLYLKNALIELQQKFPQYINQVRGVGLLLGVEMIDTLPVAQLKSELLQAGFVVGTAGKNTLRLAPPLIIKNHHIDAFIHNLTSILSEK